MKNDHTNNYPAPKKPSSDNDARSSLISPNPGSPFASRDDEQTARQNGPYYSGSARDGSGRLAASSSMRADKSGRPNPGQRHGAAQTPPVSDSRIAPELLGLVCILFASLLFISLISFNPADPGLNHLVRGAVKIKNWAGQFGSYLSAFLVDMLGFAAYVPFLFFCVLGARLCIRAPSWPWWRWCGFILLACCAAVASSAWHLGMGGIRSGGLLGRVLHDLSLDFFNPIGSGIVWSFVFLLLLQLLFGFSWRQLAIRGLRSLRESFADSGAPGAVPGTALNSAPDEGADAASGSGMIFESGSAGNGQSNMQSADLPVADSSVSETAETYAGRYGGGREDALALLAARAAEGNQTDRTRPGADKDASGPVPPDAVSLPLPAAAGTGFAPEKASVSGHGLPGGGGGLGGFLRGLFNLSILPSPFSRKRDAGSLAGNASRERGQSTLAPAAQDDAAAGGARSSAFPSAPADYAGQPPWLADLEAGRIGVPGVSADQDGKQEGKQEAPSGGEAAERAVSAAGTPAGASPGRPHPSSVASGASARLAAPGSGAGQAAVPAAFPGQQIRSVSSQPGASSGPDEFSEAPAGEAVAIGEAYREKPIPARPRRVPAKLPHLDLLQPVGDKNSVVSREELEAKGRALMTCFNDFSIQAQLVRISPGPVVTSFEVRPAPGVKASRITGLSDDMALSLKAVSVRIQSPIPGTDTVGIEIPNERREVVGLRDLIASPVFQENDQLLSMALGKDISGKPTIADLARMPHMLVAGATGTGKSVFLNAVLLSFLYKARPEQLKLLLIDPKRIEMAVYADLPHLVHPIVTEMSLAKNALDWAVTEMERRYGDIARLGVRNVLSYNQKLAEMGGNRPQNLADLEPMPYLVIIIDELADLMLTAGKEVETSIVRLAQLARAAGIHLIIATQRPSVDVVTGLIKANFPCRISFQVTSKHDSRTILDGVGAEHLLGRGDMLFKPAGGKIQRLHGAFVPDEDVAAVADYWRSQQAPAYQVDFADWGAESDSGGGSGGGGLNDDISKDPVYNEAVDFVRQQGKASISLIQRRFRIGFNRAARYIEQMEQDGIIGPADGSKPRLVR